MRRPIPQRRTSAQTSIAVTMTMAEVEALSLLIPVEYNIDRRQCLAPTVCLKHGWYEIRSEQTSSPLDPLAALRLYNVRRVFCDLVLLSSPVLVGRNSRRGDVCQRDRANSNIRLETIAELFPFCNIRCLCGDAKPHSRYYFHRKRSRRNLRTDNRSSSQNTIAIVRGDRRQFQICFHPQGQSNVKAIGCPLMAAKLLRDHHSGRSTFEQRAPIHHRQPAQMGRRRRKPRFN